MIQVFTVETSPSRQRERLHRRPPLRATPDGRTTVMAPQRTDGTLPVRLILLRYIPSMSDESTVTVSEARGRLAAMIDRARSEHEPIYLARRGRRVAALIDADDLDELLGLAEDMADIRAAEAARAEMRATGETPIPWEQVKADLGLT